MKLTIKKGIFTKQKSKNKIVLLTLGVLFVLLATTSSIFNNNIPIKSENSKNDYEINLKSSQYLMGKEVGEKYIYEVTEVNISELDLFFEEFDYNNSWGVSNWEGIISLFYGPGGNKVGAKMKCEIKDFTEYEDDNWTITTDFWNFTDGTFSSTPDIKDKVFEVKMNASQHVWGPNDLFLPGATYFYLKDCNYTWKEFEQDGYGANCENTTEDWEIKVSYDDEGTGDLHSFRINVNDDSIYNMELIELDSDDDDDCECDDDCEELGISGYNIYFLISAICVISAILVKKRSK